MRCVFFSPRSSAGFFPLLGTALRSTPLARQGEFVALVDLQTPTPLMPAYVLQAQEPASYPGTATQATANLAAAPRHIRRGHRHALSADA